MLTPIFLANAAFLFKKYHSLNIKFTVYIVCIEFSF